MMRRAVMSAALAVGVGAAMIPHGAAWAVDEPKQIAVCKGAQQDVMYCETHLSKILTVYFETHYLHHVLPQEWMCSWGTDALRAGAATVRSYGWWRTVSPRDNLFDIYGGTADMVYDPDFTDSGCDSRLDYTAGTRLTYNGNIIMASFCKNTGDPSEANTGRPYLTSVPVSWTTGSMICPGMGQDNSNDYDNHGKSWTFILSHFYQTDAPDPDVVIATGAKYYLSSGSVCIDEVRYAAETWAITSTNPNTTETRVFGPTGTCPN